MEELKKNYKKIIFLKQAKSVIIILAAVLFFDFSLFSLPTLADMPVKASAGQRQGSIADGESEINRAAWPGFMGDGSKLSEDNKVSVKWTKHSVITAYNSEAGQTDDSPCLTANNFNVCDSGAEDTIAANFLPFGAKIRIPELFGGKIFVVRDRMNKRFSNRVDVWMTARPAAINFGVKIAKIEVLE